MQRPIRPSSKKPGAKIFDGNAWLGHLSVALTLLAMVATFLVPAEVAEKLDVFVLLLALVSCISITARQLPLQSVLFAAFITTIIGTIAHGLTEHTGIPLGPLSFGKSSGPKLFKIVPWFMGFIWVIAIFSSRGVARLILRPWRKQRNYGFLQIGVTTALALVFDLALEPFAHAKDLWFWQPTKIHFTWYWATPISFLGWVFVTLITMAIILPFLIRKQPGGSSSSDFTPLVLWLGAIIFFSINVAQIGYWPSVILNAILAGVTLVFCWRGARW